MVARNASLALNALLRQVLTLLFNRVANFVASRVTTMLLTVLPTKKLASMVALLACRGGVRTFVAAVWLANVAGLLIGRSGCRAGQRGDAGASLDGFPCCVSSLAVSISGWPRILPVRLESSFLRWRCAVRVNGMENLLLAAAGHCPPKPWSALAWPAWVLRPRLAHFEAWPG